MLKQKEDVLLMVKHVRYKKVDGTLYVNSGRVAWRNQTSDSFRISANFEDIRVQRISPDQKEKVQLQLLMHNGESFTFQFSDPDGRDKQLEMRNSVKTMLQSLLPKFKDKAQAELKEKFRLLESNPDILALYKELVVSGILSSDEFWARPEFSHSTLTSTRNDSSGKTTNVSSKVQNESNVLNSNFVSSSSGQISRSFQLEERPQLVGVPSCLLSDIKPEADGANGIKYSLTHETIDAIFRAYPTVRQRHRELVPDKLSEAEFWIKFFQSHYFHRDRVQLPKEDIFADCASIDERHLLNDLRRSKHNRMNAHLDLINLTDHDIGQGYGVEQATSQTIQKVTDSSAVSETTTSDASNASLSANQMLLRRFNNHSIHVLKSLGPSELAAVSLPIVTTSDSQANSVKDAVSTEPLKKHIYGNELVGDEEPPHFRLELSSINDYLEGPTSNFAAEPSKKLDNMTSVSLSHQTDTPISKLKLEQALMSCKNLMKGTYQTKLKPNITLLGALESQLALADVSPGGCLVGGKLSDDRPKSGDLFSDQSTLRLSDTSRTGRSNASQRNADTSASDEDVRGPMLLNQEQQRELSLLYSSAAELLRHFWACFPVTSPQLAEKLDRIAASIVRFRASKVAHFAASLDQSFGSKSDPSLLIGNSENSSDRRELTGVSFRSRVTSHLESMLDAAQLKHSDWKCRRQ